MPRVLNKHKDVITAGAVYIGRGSPYGNPFSHIAGGKAAILVETREEACTKFSLWLDGRIDIPGWTPPTIEQIKRELKGKDLVCFCKPARCHGDTLLRIANG